MSMLVPSASGLAKLKIAVVGATGNVGRLVLSILAENGIPKEHVIALASDRSVGQEVSYGEDAVLKVLSLNSFDFSHTQLALSSPGAKVSAEFAPRAAAQGCVVIDNTSHFRMDEEVPLIVPEINGEALEGFRKKRIIANPNCTTIQLVMALRPLSQIAPLKRVVVSSYQSVSGAGKNAMDELYAQTRSVLVADPTISSVFQKPISFNVIPQIDSFLPDGSTKEEWKIQVETKKILGTDVALAATCVRVPVFIGHGIAANVEFESPISCQEARRALKAFPGVEVFDRPEDEHYVTPLDCVGEDSVFVSRIRKDPSVSHGLALWIVTDNLRKGAALNTVQIANLLARKYL